MSELRKVEVLKDGLWEEIEFIELEVGNKFRMFDSPEEPVIGHDGTTEWIVVKGPYRRRKDEVLTVETVDTEEQFKEYQKAQANSIGEK